jgi:hypothetical protein
MINRFCPGCPKHFFVLATSKQTWCSLECKILAGAAGDEIKAIRIASPEEAHYIATGERKKAG